MSDDNFYDSRENYQGLSDNELDQRYLALSGINQMPRPYKMIPGRRNRPGFCCQGSEQSGGYFPDNRTFGVTLLGMDALWVRRNTLRVFDRFGNYVDILVPDELGGNYAIALPTMDGSLALKEHFESQQILGTKDGVNDEFTVSYPIKKLLDVKLNGVGDTELVIWSSGSNALTWVGTPLPNVSDSVQVIYVRE